MKLANNIISIESNGSRTVSVKRLLESTVGRNQIEALRGLHRDAVSIRGMSEVATGGKNSTRE